MTRLLSKIIVIILPIYHNTHNKRFPEHFFLSLSKNFALLFQGVLHVKSSMFRVPTGTGKTGKMRKLFPVMEKSGNFEKMSKSRRILNKSGKSQGKL